MTIKKRIEKMEAKLKVMPGAILLEEPMALASTNERQKFMTAVSDALAVGLLVIVIRTDDELPRLTGVTYAPTRFEGQLALLAATPADGFDSALAKALYKARNTSISIFHEVAS